MPIFRRITDVLTANVNDLIERIADPEALLRQAAREMEAAVEQTMSAAARSIAGERLLSRQIAVHRRQSAALHDAARSAVAHHDDSHARALLADRRRHDDLAAALDDQLVAARTQNARLRRQLDALRLRLSEARQSMHLHIARNCAAAAQRQLATDAFRVDVTSDAFSRFDRLRERIDRTEEESRAWLELSGACDQGADAAESAVEQELAALKQEFAATT